ncbi:MAG: hypothetical protein ACTHN0_09615 [Aquihabitans sp.]
MPMMRRGPLDRYPPEWVLRQANAHEAEGSIEFHTDQQPITLYIRGGRAYAAEVGVNLSEAQLADRPVLDETRQRDQLIALLAGVLPAKAGWYFHDPLGHHPSSGVRTWETATLLMDVRSRSHETRTLASWTERTVTLCESRDDSITLGADAWAVVVKLAGSADAGELRTRLGWSPDRIAAALAEMEDRSLLAPAHDAPPVPPAPARLPAPPPVPVAAAAGHHTGPLAPPPATAPTHRRIGLPSRRSGH